MSKLIFKFIIIVVLINDSSCIFGNIIKKKPPNVPVHRPVVIPANRPVIVPVHRPPHVIVPINRPVHHSRPFGQQCTYSNSPSWICCSGVVQWVNMENAFHTACCHTRPYDPRFENCCLGGHVRRFC